MSWQKVISPVFPMIEPLTHAHKEEREQALQSDLKAIRTTDWSPFDERALDEAHRMTDAEIARGKTVETKATAYLVVLGALVPLVLTLEGANWEKKSGPAPEWLKIIVLVVATIYTAAAFFHSFKALQVSGFHRVGEVQLTEAWRSRYPLRRLTRSTLVASRLSHDRVNAKVTRIRATHEHLIRAFGAFVLLLLLDPFFYVIGWHSNIELQKPIVTTGRIIAGTKGENPRQEALSIPRPRPTDSPTSEKTSPTEGPSHK